VLVEEPDVERHVLVERVGLELKGLVQRGLRLPRPGLEHLLDLVVEDHDAEGVGH